MGNGCFFAFTLHIFYSKLLEMRFEKKINYVSGWLVCLLLWNGCSYMFAEYPLINSICGTVTNFLILHFLYKGSIQKKIIIIFTVVVLGFVSEVLAAFILSYTEINGRVQGDERNNWWYIGNAVSKILWFVFVKVITYITKKENKAEVKGTEWIDIFLVPVSSLIIFFIVIRENFYKITISMLIIYIILLLINILNYLVYQKMQTHAEEMLDKQLLIQQNEYYRMRFEDTEKQWNLLRKIRHDMCNEYILHLSYIENEDYAELKQIYSDMIGKLKKQTSFIETGNVGIDAITNYKIEILRELNTQIEKEIKVVGEINMNHGDANTLFGVFFDNIIEALEKIEEKDRKVKIKILADETALLIRLRNTFDGVIERDDMKEIITRKKDKENHGIGLKKVKEIITKYSGQIDFQIDRDVFEVAVFLYTAK